MPDANVLDAFASLCATLGVSPAAASAEIAVHFARVAATDSRALVLLPSGRVLDLISPSPLDIEPDDIAAGQADTIRWGGATSHAEGIRDAYHAMLVLEILRKNSPNGVAAPLELAALVHDASEGLLGGFDPIKPLKPFLGPGFRDLDARLQEAVHVRLGLPRKLSADWKIKIKEADLTAAATEVHHLTPWTPVQIRKSLEITVAPLSTDLISRRYGTPTWTPWTRAQSMSMYSAELARLMSAVTR